MQIGETLSFTIKNCNNGKKNDKLEGDITITYREKKTSLQKNAYGTIKSKEWE